MQGLGGAQESQQEPACTCPLEVIRALPPLTPLGKVMVKGETQKGLLGLLFGGDHQVQQRVLEEARL